jgi:hypothetical protein
MGYTHYLIRENDFSDKDWVELIKFVEKISKFCKSNNIDFKININDSFISVNGKTTENSCETFIIYKNLNEEFSFCKTNKLPYDSVVCLILLCIKTICHKECKISSDGQDDWDDEESNWYKAKEDFYKIFECEPLYPFDKK